MLTVITETVCLALDENGNARAVAIDISEAFEMFWHAALLPKLKIYGVSGRIFDLILL